MTPAVTPEPQLATAGLAGSTPAACKHGGERGLVLQRAVRIEQRPERHALRRRDAARTQAGTRLRHRARKTVGGARIEDLHARITDQRLDLRRVPDEAGPEASLECLRRSRGRLRIRHGAALGLPFLEAAVQDADLVVAHGAEHPPHAGRRVEALAVVGDDVRAVADAHGADLRRELLWARQHVRQRVRLVGHGIDVEAQRARECGRQCIPCRHRGLTSAGATSRRARQHWDRPGARRASRCRRPRGSGWS